MGVHQNGWFIRENPILVGGNWLPSIWHFPRNIGFMSNHPLIDEVIFFRGVAKNHQPASNAGGQWGLEAG